MRHKLDTVSSRPKSSLVNIARFLFLSAALFLFSLSAQAQYTGSVTYDVSVGDSTAINIQWYMSDLSGSGFTALSGETNQTYTMSANGLYYASYDTPDCAGLISNISVYSDDPSTLVLDAATNSPTATYQWMSSGADILGETNGTLTTVDPGQYSVEIDDGDLCIETIIEVYQPLTPDPILSVVKSVAGESFSTPLVAGDTVDYEFLVSNDGNVDITGVVPVDDGVEIDGAAGTGSLSAFSPVSADLAVGESDTFTATYTLSAADAAAIAASADPSSAISNVATANGTPVSGTLPPVTPTPPVTSGPAANPSLSVTKSTTGQSFSNPLAAGDTVSYEFVVTNTGNVDINSAVPVDSGVQVAGAAGTGSLSAFSPSDADLIPGASQTFTATYTLSAGDAAAIAAAADPSNAISNAATADGTPTSGVLPPVTETLPVTSGPTSAPGLTVLKTVTTVLTGMPSVGDQIVYNVNVSNTGNVNIDDVNATDSGPTFNSVAGTGSLVIAPQDIDLVPGADQDFTITYTVTQVDIDNLAMASNTSQAIENSAGASGIPSSGVLPPPTPSTVMTGISAAPNLSVVKNVTAESFSNPAAANDTVDYEFIVTNDGNVDINGVVPVDNGVEIDGAAGTGSLSAFSPASADLAPGENQTFTATYTLSAGDAVAVASSSDIENAISNVATANGTPVSGTLPPVTPTPPVTSGPTSAPNMTVLKTVTTVLTGMPSVGDQIVYNVNVSNTGNVNIDSVNATDSGPTFNGVAGTGSLVITPQNIDLVPGVDQDFTITYTVTLTDINNLAMAADTTQAINNSASASGTPTSGTLPAITPSSVATGIAALPNLSAVKTVTAGNYSIPLTAGDTVNYQIVVENTGNVSINSVSPVDSGVQIDGSAGTGILSAFSPVNASLAPGESQTFTATYTLSAADAAAVSGAADPENAIANTASATGTPVDGTLPVIPSSNVTTGPITGPSLRVVKNVTAESFSSPVAANDTVDYEFIVTNNGTIDINGVVPVDDGVEIDGAAGTGSLSAFSPASADLAPGENQTFTATYTLSAGDAAAIASSADPENTISNVASANGTPVSGTLPPVTPTPPVTAGPAADPSLSVTKSTTGQSFSNPLAAGDTVEYEFVVTNDGNVDINDAVPVDSGVEIDGAAGTGSLSAFSPSDADLTPGASQTFTATYTLSAGDAATITAAADPSNAISNAAMADGLPSGGTLPPVTETPPVTTGPLADIQVTKTLDSPAPHYVGDTLIYTIVVSNVGVGNAQNVVIEDAATGLANITIVAVTGSNEDPGDCSAGGAFPCTVNDIGNSEAVQLTVTGVAQ